MLFLKTVILLIYHFPVTGKIPGAKVGMRVGL